MRAARRGPSAAGSGTSPSRPEHRYDPRIDADDATLLEAARSGDRDALDRLLRQHYDRVHAVCRRIAGTTRDADDAAQEAMIRIVRGLPNFDGRSALSTWVYRIATNAALDELRRRDRRPPLRDTRHDDDHPVGRGAGRGVDDDQADPTAHRRVESVVDAIALDDALAALPDDYRVAVVLRDVADLDYDEIAAALGVPIGTVKSRIARGRGRLVEEITGNREPSHERPTGGT